MKGRYQRPSFENVRGNRRKGGSILQSLRRGQPGIVEEDQEGEDTHDEDDEVLGRRRKAAEKYQTTSPIDAQLIDKHALQK